KNIATLGNKILPNTRFKTVTLRGVTGPALTWLVPRTGQCLRGATAPLAVVASSSRTVASVRFSADGRRIGVDRDGAAGLFAVTWHIGGVNGGAHRVTALATDAAGKRLSATRVVRICK
ncbi:MAG: Ig-like domain-containing protein, partial [Gaiellaceae bacterium]